LPGLSSCTSSKFPFPGSFHASPLPPAKEKNAQPQPRAFLLPHLLASVPHCFLASSLPCLSSSLSITLTSSMLIVMQSHASEQQVRDVCERIESLGLKAHPIPGSGRTAIGITGNSGEVDLGVLESMPGVIECIPVTKPYKLVSRDVKEEDSVIKIPTPSGDVLVGGNHIAMVAGPCAVESEEQCFAIAEHLKSTGIRLFRGGAYKPRTSPYSFQGLGLIGLKILSHVRKQFGFGIVTEAIDNESLDLVEEYADVIQIGARNMQNFSLLKRAGRAKLPVLLKRGMSATLDEFLMAAEYILSEGNYNVMLCERGVRTFSDFSRNTLDLAVVPAVKRRSHLPILVDPSHGTGKRHKVLPLSRAAVAVGADGLLVEVHHQPEKALSDGIQSILPDEFADLLSEVRQISSVLHRQIN
jgi:3-deoxy-7-phosphoheptulonate synthase